MRIEVLKSKIHCARVTQTELHYDGSITLPEEMIEAANLLPNEKVQVLNLNTGARIETYVIKGKRNGGSICLNGPAARTAQIGDAVIVIAYASMEMEEAKKFKPALIYPDEKNRIKQ